MTRQWVRAIIENDAAVRALTRGSRISGAGFTERLCQTRHSSVESAHVVRQVMPMSNRRNADHYTRRAKEQGFAARSVFKLQELDKKHQLFKRGQRVLDLGCAPGSWLKFMAQRVGPKGRAVGIDRFEVSPMAPHVHTIAGDIYETDPQIFFQLAQGHFDVITSDMAPDTCGNRFVDHVRSIELCQAASGVAEQLLIEGGAFVCKVFEGEDLQSFVNDLKGRYKTVKRFKPKSTRNESVELFLTALGKKNPPHTLTDEAR